MKRAIAISKTAMVLPGSEPFGAVVVRNGKIVGEGLSRALATLDVTSHGEVEAIRDANRRLKRLDLSDCEIYTTCEPCPLCVAAISIARLRKMYYAATLDQAGKAFDLLPPNGRFPVDINKLIAEERATVDKRQTPAEQKLDAESFEVLKAWALKRKGPCRHDNRSAVPLHRSPLSDGDPIRGAAQDQSPSTTCIKWAC